VKRRKALKQISFGLSAGLVLPSFLSACKKDDPGPEVPYDGTVAVIGAGAAGLYAATILNSKGIKVTILEAANQVGGRIRSLRNQQNIPAQSIADFPVELGAEMIYGSNSSFAKILSFLNLDSVDLASGADQFILENAVKSSAEWQGDGDFQAVQNFVGSLKTYSGPAVTVKEAAAGMSERALTLLNSQVGQFYGSSIDRIGVVGLSQALQARQHDEKNLLVKANPWQDILISRFDDVQPLVQLNTAVKTINYSADPIVITDANDQEILANKVIVTVPVSILKTGAIAFSPGLPDSITSPLSRIGMDDCVRVVLDFKKNFWGEGSSFIWGGTSFPVCINAGISRSEQYRTMSITVYGAKAAELSAKGSDMVLDILAELDAIYAGQGTLYIRRDINTNQIISFIQDWTKEEFIKGGFSYPFPSATQDDRVSLSKPVDDKIFFAGEATDINGDVGNVNGALASAERVAEDVIKSITSTTP